MKFLDTIRRNRARKAQAERQAAYRERKRREAAERKKEDSQTRCDGCGCPLGNDWVYCANCGKKITRK